MTSPTRADLEKQTARISDQAKAADLLRRFDEASAKIAATEDPIERATLETELATILSEANAAANASGPGGGGNGGGNGGGKGGTGGGGFLTKEAFFLVALIVAAAFVFLFWYFAKLGPEGFSSIESTRPLLVLTLIISMLGFGGLLIMRALFSPYDGDELQNRFRLAREIFLVFSGIFGTIIGFYFGSGDDKPNGALSLDVGFSEGQVTAAVGGGTEPFIGIFTLSGETGGVVMSLDERVLSYKPESGECPADATISVVDGRGARAEAKVDCDEDEGDDNESATDANATKGGGDAANKAANDAGDTAADVNAGT